MLQKKRISDNFDSHMLQLFDEIEQLREFITLQRSREAEPELINKLMFELRNNCAKLNALIDLKEESSACA